MSERKGKVYLIGAGPGDPGLITVKGRECLRSAEVVVYDYLANPELLQEARSDAEVIYVGKSGSKHALPQEEINKLLVEKAAQGKTVARLKGGDPYVFGRGGEEAEELIDAGLPFEVVPGITSAIAVPAYAGIPITHRDFTSSFAVITGHEKPEKDASSVDWPRISTGIGTLVFLMGVGNLPTITQQLIANGRSSDTPAAVIQWGTRSEQRTVTGTLSRIEQLVEEAGLKPPAVLVVGQVVTLRDKLRWFDNRPLSGKRVLVTRSREQASDLSRLLRDSGAEAIEFPSIKTVPPEDYSPLEEAISRIGTYDWIVFTSVNGVESFMDRLYGSGQDVRALKGVRLCAIGPATAGRIEQNGLRVDLIPKDYVAESAVEALLREGVSGKRFLMPRAAVARPVLTDELRKAGAEVEEVVAYRTVVDESPADPIIKRLEKGDVDVITFTSSSTVDNFVAKVGKERLGMLDRVLVACIGPITASTAEKHGLRIGLMAEEYTIPSLVDAIVAKFSGQESSRQNS